MNKVFVGAAVAAAVVAGPLHAGPAAVRQADGIGHAASRDAATRQGQERAAPRRAGARGHGRARGARRRCRRRCSSPARWCPGSRCWSRRRSRGCAWSSCWPRKATASPRARCWPGSSRRRCEAQLAQNDAALRQGRSRDRPGAQQHRRGRGAPGRDVATRSIAPSRLSKSGVVVRKHARPARGRRAHRGRPAAGRARTASSSPRPSARRSRRSGATSSGAVADRGPRAGRRHRQPPQRADRRAGVRRGGRPADVPHHRRRRDRARGRGAGSGSRAAEGRASRPRSSVAGAGEVEGQRPPRHARGRQGDPAGPRPHRARRQRGAAHRQLRPRQRAGPQQPKPSRCRPARCCSARDGAYVQLVADNASSAARSTTGLQTRRLVEITVRPRGGELVVAKAGTFLRAGDLVSAGRSPRRTAKDRIDVASTAIRHRSSTRDAGRTWTNRRCLSTASTSRPGRSAIRCRRCCCSWC